MKNLFILMPTIFLLSTIALVLPSERPSSWPERIEGPNTSVKVVLQSSTRARLWVEKGEQFLREHGREKFLEECKSQNGHFTSGSLVLMVFDLNGNRLSSAGNAEPDPGGQAPRYLPKKIVEVAKAKGEEGRRYPYTNPQTNKVEQRSVFAKRVGDVILCAMFQ